MWSAAPTSTASHSHVKPQRDPRDHVPGLNAALKDLSIDGQSLMNGAEGRNRYDDDYEQTMDDLREEPLGHNVEHACR